jgi:hypothetical protein
LYGKTHHNPQYLLEGVLSSSYREKPKTNKNKEKKRNQKTPIKPKSKRNQPTRKFPHPKQNPKN